NSQSIFVAPASCRLSRGHLGLGGEGGTPSRQPPGRRRYKDLPFTIPRTTTSLSCCSVSSLRSLPLESSRKGLRAADLQRPSRSPPPEPCPSQSRPHARSPKSHR